MNESARHGQPVDTPIARSSGRVDPGREHEHRTSAFGTREENLEKVDELRAESESSRFAKSKQAIPRERVRAVFLAARDTDATYKALGKKYGIASATAGRIANGKRVRYRRLTRDLRRESDSETP